MQKKNTKQTENYEIEVIVVINKCQIVVQNRRNATNCVI